MDSTPDGDFFGDSDPFVICNDYQGTSLPGAIVKKSQSPANCQTWKEIGTNIGKWRCVTISPWSNRFSL
jgi:hypothetical protein